MVNRIKESNITPGAITNDKLAPGTISSNSIAPGTIANDRLVNTGITINGTTIALGASGEIVAGTDWQSVIVADGSTVTTAVAGEGYFIDTTSAAHTINLPNSPTIGDTVSVVDYGGNSATNKITLGANGNKILGSTLNKTISTNEIGIVLVYTDSTKGWVVSGAYIEGTIGLVGVPGAPTIGTATETGPTSATVDFTAPSDNGDSVITSYTATSSPDGVTGTLSQAGSGTITVTGLTQGTTYTFTVTATNAIGTSAASASSNSITTPSPAYVTATGGTITTSSDYKIHTFTGDGSFVVSCAGNPSGSTAVDYLVIAGGGGGGIEVSSSTSSGGGGAGGYRFSNGTASGCYSAGPAPLGASALPVSATTYPITIGGGGSPSEPLGHGAPGTPSVFSTITSTGGGGGGGLNGDFPEADGRTGGSGGGGKQNNPGGAGNTPPVSPPQGNSGGPSVNTFPSGGGGGAGAVGATSAVSQSGSGGNGLASSITGSPVTRGGGGGGGGVTNRPENSPPGSGGSGGGGAGGTGNTDNATPGSINTGGGGGGAGNTYPGSAYKAGGAGGSGIVIIRYKFQN